MNIKKCDKFFRLFLHYNRGSGVAAHRSKVLTSLFEISLEISFEIPFASRNPDINRSE